MGSDGLDAAAERLAAGDPIKIRVIDKLLLPKNNLKKDAESGKIDSMEHVDLRKLNSGELTQVRRQVVRLKKMGKPGKEIEELTGVRQNCISEIWTAYQREEDSSLELKKRGFQKGTHLRPTPEEQTEIQKTVITRRPEKFGIPGSL